MSVHIAPLEIAENFESARSAKRNRSGTFERAAFRSGLFCLDASLLTVSFLVAYWIRFELKVTLAPEVTPSETFYANLVTVSTAVWLCLYAFSGLYRWENLLGGTSEYSRVFNANTIGIMLVILGTFFVPSMLVSRAWLVGSWLLSIVLVCGGRFTARRLVYILRKRGRFLSPTVIVGSNGEAYTLANQLSDLQSGYRVVGTVGDRDETRQPEGSAIPHLGRHSELASVISRLGVRNVVVAASSLDRTELLGLFERLQPLEGVTIQLSTGLYEVLTTGINASTVGSVPLISISRLRLKPSEVAVKTTFEYLFASVALILLLPAFLLIAILIKLDSPGPVLHRRHVLGLGGKRFAAFKFRTMRQNGQKILDKDPELSKTLKEKGKLKDDPRITRLGKWLRRFSLDELPQLANVLLGQMSLVGPRMITDSEAHNYGNHRANLLTVKPGITGLWQVSGRSELDYADRVRLDMHYIRNYTVWQDLQILLVQTPGAVLRGRGAY